MYYVFDRSSKPGRWIKGRLGDIPGIDWSLWRSGSRLPQAPPAPLRFTLKPFSPNASDQSPHLPAYLGAACPLFTDALLAALRECGVSNLDAYHCAITDPDDGTVYTHYKAVNLVGLIAAADMARSNATVHPGGPPLIDVDFDGLVIDERKAGGNLMFRLAESTNAIIVHQRVRDYLLSAGFDDLEFHEPGNVAL